MSHSFILKVDYLAQRCRNWGFAFDPGAARNRSLWLSECRLAAAKLADADDPARESTSAIVYYGVKACMRDPAPMARRMAQMLWFIIVAAAPRALARRLIALRFLVGQRPRWLTLAVAMLAKAKALAWPGSVRMQKANPRADWGR